MCWTSGVSTVFHPHIHIRPPPVFIPLASSLKVKQKLIICLELQRAPAPRLLFPTLDLLAYPLVGLARTHLFKWQRKRPGWCHGIIWRQIVLPSLWVFSLFFFFNGGVFHPELHRERLSAHYHESNSTRCLSHSAFLHLLISINPTRTRSSVLNQCLIPAIPRPRSDSLPLRVVLIKSLFRCNLAQLCGTDWILPGACSHFPSFRIDFPPAL